MSDVFKALMSNQKEYTDEEKDLILEEVVGDSGFDGGRRQLAFTILNPTRIAGGAPEPLRLPYRTPFWEELINEEYLYGQDWILLGAGASVLKKDWQVMNGKIVYGINYLTWFHPTFLQIVDPKPWKMEIEPRGFDAVNGETQLVVSTWGTKGDPNADKKSGFAREHAGQILPFEITHPAVKANEGRRLFAETHQKPLMWTPNSLAYALNVAYWFRPRRIVLAGFDWGGPHNFGDGRAKGSQCEYKTKQDRHELLEKITYLRDELEERGMSIKQVGPSKLDCFEQVDSFREALE